MNKIGKVGNIICFMVEIAAKVVSWRRIIAVICLFLTVFVVGVAESAYAQVQVGAKAAVLIDAETGKQLWQQNAAEQLPPASCTKILTALLAMDIGSLEKECEVTPQAAAVGESSADLQAGEKFTLAELLDAALLKSANDACFAIAEGVAGSEPFFVRLMNLKADALGAGGAKLQNTNGLPADGHIMSAEDLAELSRIAMQKAEFRERVGAKNGTMQGGSYNRSLKNTNKLLSMNEYVTGIKTGTTNAAGACLVSSMEREGRKVIAVVLHSNNRYGESLSLLNFGIDNFVNRRLVQKGERLGAVPIADGAARILAEASADLTVTLPKGADLGDLQAVYAWRQFTMGDSVAVGEQLGTLRFCCQGEEIGAVNLLAANAYQPSFWERLSAKFAK